jgi:hypothetical protein
MLEHGRAAAWAVSSSTLDSSTFTEQTGNVYENKQQCSGRLLDFPTFRRWQVSTPNPNDGKPDQT